jgi:hypothetical protein
VPRSHHIAQRCASLPHAFAVASLLGSNWAPGDVPTSVQTCEHCLVHFHQTATHIKRTLPLSSPPPPSSVTVQQLLSMSSSLKPGYKNAWNRHALVLCFLTLNECFVDCLCKLRREKCDTVFSVFRPQPPVRVVRGSTLLFTVTCRTCWRVLPVAAAVMQTLWRRCNRSCSLPLACQTKCTSRHPPPSSKHPRLL